MSYKIIGSKHKNEKNIGGKAYNLVFLDKMLLTPSFIVISSSIFKKHSKNNSALVKIFEKKQLTKNDYLIIRTNINKLKIDKEILKEVKDNIKELHLKNLIFRSSFVEEDSILKSFAGQFDSFRSEKKDIEKFIKKVWASRFSDKVFSYSNNSNYHGMAVIIQDFIISDYSGVVFTNKEKAPELFVEYSDKGYSSVVDGSTVPHFAFKIVNDPKLSDYYLSSTERGGDVRWLENLSEIIYEISQKYRHSLDLEFCVKNEKIYLLQLRSLTQDVDYGGLSFVFDGKDRWKYNIEDFSKKKLNYIFNKIGIKNNVSFFVSGSSLKIEMKSFLLFLSEIREKSTNREFISKFLKFFSTKKHEEYEFSLNIAEFFSGINELKKNRFLMSVLNFIHLFIRNELLSFLNDKYGIRDNKEYISLIAPPVSFAVEKLILNKEFYLYDENFTMSKEEDLLRKKADMNLLYKNIKKNHQKIINTLNKMEKEKREMFVLLKKVFWLNDQVDFYHDKTDINYYKYIFNFFKTQKIKVGKNVGLNDITMLSKNSLAKMMSEKKIRIKKKLEINTKEKTYSVTFPLKGTIASPGNFKGCVKIIKNNSDIEKLGLGDILVTQYTKPSLVVGMAVVNGIITETGGMTSHAAIVSRELAKPCLVAVKDCTKILKEGEMIEVVNGMINKI